MKTKVRSQAAGNFGIVYTPHDFNLSFTDFIRVGVNLSQCFIGNIYDMEILLIM